MSESIHERIKRLRKEKNLTQLQLAEKLNVTDKAVSKWESAEGNPDISLLAKLASIFEVSVDYLLIGKDPLPKLKYVSRFEQCVKTTDLALYQQIKINNNRSDETGKTLGEYVLELENIILFKAMVQDKLIHLNDYLEDNKLNEKDTIKLNLFNQFIKLAFLIKQPEIILFDYLSSYKMRQGKIFDLAHESLQAWRMDKNIPHNVKLFYVLKDDFFNTLTFNEDLADTVITNVLTKQANGLFWFAGLPHLLHFAYKNENKKLIDACIDYITQYNQDTSEFYSKKRADPSFKLISPGLVGFYNNVGEGKLEIKNASSFVLKETFDIAFNRLDYPFIEKINMIQQKLLPMSPNFALHITTEYEIRMLKTQNDPHVSLKEKKIQSVLHDDLVDINQLLYFNDFEFYQEMIERPCSHVEILFRLIQEKKIKDVFDFAVKYELGKIIDNIKENKTANLFTGIEVKKLITLTSPNSSYFINKLRNHFGGNDNFPFRKVSDLEFFIDLKREIPRTKLLSLEDHRFFEYFIKYWSPDRLSTFPPEGYHQNPRFYFDSVLEGLILQQPDNYLAQNVLLNAGAKLHHRWVENPGDEYEKRHDEVDDVSTQLLKNQIQILLKK
jgi:transcriptional regulator with XRE-family HTH domain